MCKLTSVNFLNLTLLFDEAAKMVEDSVFNFQGVQIVEPKTNSIYNLKIKTHNVVNNQVVCIFETPSKENEINSITAKQLVHEDIDVTFFFMGSLKPRKAVLLVDIGDKTYGFEAFPEYGEEYVS